MLRVLLLTRWRAARNAYRADQQGPLKLVVGVLLGVIFAAGIYASAHWFFAECLAVEPIGEVVVRRMLGMALLTIFALLTFSSLISAFSTFYLAEDLQLLVSRPVPPEPLYTARFLETGLHSSWMIVPFSLPIFIAAGRLFEAGPGFYAALAVVYMALAVVPTGIAVVASLVLTSLLSARRARHLFVIAGSLMAGVLLFMFRSLAPERFMNPGQRTALLDVVRTMKGSDPTWLPSTWALDALWPHLGYGTRSDTHPVLLLLSLAAATFFVGAWAFRALYPRAYSRAQEGLQLGGGPSPARRRTARGLDELVRRASRGRASPGIDLAMLRKDSLVFIRDTAQWSQLLMLLSIVAIYVLNFKYIRLVTGTGLISELGLHFLNLALSGFVVVALAARFVFPAVSLEGPAFWLVRSSPSSTHRFLWAKTRSWSYFLALFGNLLILTTSFFLETSTVLAVAAVVTITPLIDGLVGLGIGLGARYPRFDADNAAKIATGLGGVLFMILGAALLVVVVVAAIGPTVAASRMLISGWVPSWRTGLLLVMATAIAWVVPVAAGRWAVRIGAAHLESLDR